MGFKVLRLVPTEIESTDGGSISMGNSSFPVNDSTSSRSTATFGDSMSFTSRSTRQLVDTPTAVIAKKVTIVGVNYNGPVSLTFEDSDVNVNDIHIVDEGGYCDTLNTITVQSGTNTSSGVLVINSPFSYMKARTSKNGLISETSEEHLIKFPKRTGEVIIENPDGSTTTVDHDTGSVITTNPDGSTLTILEDGTSIAVSVSGNDTSTVTILPDGTQIEATASNNGNQISFTTFPDGSTLELEEQNNGNVFSFTVSADGTTTEIVDSNNGNSTSVIVQPDGTVISEASFSSGKIEDSTVFPDGSSSSFERSTSGKIKIINVSSDGITVTEDYVPWKSFYTVTTEPPGTSEKISPNPFAT